MKRTAAAGLTGIIASGIPPAYSNAQGSEKKNITLDQARKVHNKMLIVDGHNDTPVERVARKEKPLNWKQRDPKFHTDIPKMKEAGNYTGFFIVGNGLAANVWVTMERVLTQIETYPDDLMLVLTSDDFVRSQERKKIGIMMAVEGAAKWLDGKLDILPFLYRSGVRAVGITHGEGGSEPIYLQSARSSFGYCTQDDRDAERKNTGGLTPLGLDVLKTNDKLGIVTDLSHINDRAFYEVLEHSPRPPVMSHTAVFGLCNHWRCMTDDQIKALAGAGGVVGITFVPGYIHPEKEKATIDRVVEHICYAGELVGMDYVGIGTDFDGIGETPVVPDATQLVYLTQSMMAHGMTEEEIRKVWGGNFLRVFQQTIDKPEK